MCLVLLLLLVLKRLQLQESQTEGNEGHTPNDGNRALLNIAPGELLRVEIKELEERRITIQSEQNTKCLKPAQK